jgi:hypothetical protein
LSRRSATWAVKSVASVGVVGGAAVALALPVDASPAALSLPVATTTGDGDRTDDLTASRAAHRAQAPEPAVSAPVNAAPVVPEQVGVSGVTAVAKPKPKPTPTTTSTSSRPAGVTFSTSVSGPCGGLGLIPDAVRLCSAVNSAFNPPSIGGYRPNAGEHSTGQAVDFMISSQSQGDAIAAFVQSHVSEFDVQYIIWRQRYWAPGGSWELMEDRGSTTANHYDHVHVTVS